MKARGGDPRLAQTLALSAAASLGERAIEAAALRREIAAMTASGAGDTLPASCCAQKQVVAERRAVGVRGIGQHDEHAVQER